MHTLCVYRVGGEDKNNDKTKTWRCSEVLTNLNARELSRNDPSMNLAMEPNQIYLHIYQLKQQKLLIIVQPRNKLQTVISRTGLCKLYQEKESITLCRSNEGMKESDRK